MKNYQKLLISVLSLCFFGLTACQTVPKQEKTTTTVINQKKLTPKRLENFNISGKMGFVDMAKKQSGSAFYTWVQEKQRFSMQLEGALGIGYTLIEFNGKTASLTNAEVGTVTANSPEKLLAKATGWKAPISQLPYWISGYPAPSDNSQKLDNQNRLSTASNGNWSASFSYQDDNKLPRKIVSKHKNGSKVTLIIKHN